MEAELLRRFGKIFRNDDGVVVVVFGLMAASLIGVGALAIDLGRLMTYDTQLQNAADAAALAGAAELTGAPGARAKAADAAKSLLRNSQTYGASGPALVEFDTPSPGFDFRFYSEISPAGDTAATGDDDARFIEVTTRQGTMNTLLARLFGGPDSATAQARAVAGYKAVACRVPPVMMCNPDPDESDAFQGFQRGQMFLLQQQGGTGLYGPGAFGLLDLPGQNQSTPSTIEQMLASAAPNFCFVDGVTVRTGVINQHVQDGVNTRFDMGSTTAAPPAPNVIKGRQLTNYNGGSLNHCNLKQISQTDYTKVRPLPRDNCFRGIDDPSTVPTTCPTLTSGRPVGDGNWSAEGDLYWNLYHAPFGRTKPAGYGTTAFTRFDLYLWELGYGYDEATATFTSNGTPNLPDTANSTRLGEAGAPMCAQRNGIPAGGPERRIIYVAIVNCMSDGPISGNSTPPMRTAAFAKFFLTEPATNDGIYAEFLGLEVPANNDKIFHEIVQLYR
jgi:Flp pilus assembly protein TadG